MPLPPDAAAQPSLPDAAVRPSLPGAAVRPSLDVRAFNDLVDFMYAQSAKGRFSPTIGFLVCGVIFLTYAPWWTLLVIVGIQLAGTAMSEVLRRRNMRLAPHQSRASLARGYTAASAVCGLSWGCAGALWYVPGAPETQALLVVLLIGGVTGTLVTRSSHLPSLTAFILTAGVPFVGVLLAAGTKYTIAIAVLSLLYGLALLSWGRGLNAMYLREAKARLQNDDLVHDIKAAKEEAEQRADEATKARYAAEAGARSKSQFLSTISHEVRTPLNGIQGMAEVLSDTDLTTDQRDYVSIIRESSDNLRLILEDVIDLAQLNTGEAEFETIGFSPARIVAQVTGILEPEARRKHLPLKTHIGPDAPDVIFGDEKRCRQVLLNLVGNAVKFTDAGHVHIGVHLYTDDTHARGAMLRFCVSDTGIGIAPDKIDALFDAFSQIDQTTTRRHGGRGLGLALAQRITAQMHGAIGVTSTLGEGSEFWFDVPVHGARAAAAHAPEAFDAHDAGMTRAASSG